MSTLCFYSLELVNVVGRTYKSILRLLCNEKLYVVPGFCTFYLGLLMTALLIYWFELLYSKPVKTMKTVITRFLERSQEAALWKRYLTVHGMAESTTTMMNNYLLLLNIWPFKEDGKAIREFTKNGKWYFYIYASNST